MLEKSTEVSSSSDDTAQARKPPTPDRETLVQLFARLETSERGLTNEEAARRLDDYGPNEPGAVHRASPLMAFLRFATNPLVLILLVASAITAFLGEFVNSGVIAAIVALSVVVNFLQAYRSQRAVDRLREEVAPTATTLRDGQWAEVPRREIVPGDVVRLSAGDLVPGDARLIQSRDLHMQQAALTGESMPVEKSAAQIPAGPVSAALIESASTVFVGTSAVSGTATAVVFATGRNTAFGDIAQRLAAKSPETEFDRGTRRFGILIMETVFFLVLFILTVNLALHRNAIESLLFAVALAVGLTPEFLPMITTVTLSTGAVRMARKKVIVKHLAAIQNLGSIDVLCTDKTGTLTEGVMTLEESIDSFGVPSQRVLFLAGLNSRFETGIKSPLDTAILKSIPAASDGWEKTDEIPFDFDRRRLSIVVRKNGACLMITKGAPEAVLDASVACESAGATVALDESSRARCEQTYRALSSRGFRVLAVAYRAVDEAEGFDASDERDMTLGGFLAFFDPPLEDVANSLAALKRDGVSVKVITGDNELVTRSVCEAVGIDAGRIVLGTEIERMGDTALAHVAEEVEVFARVSPAQKNRIIAALKRRSHVVGFMGDGINDAPSLHSADVGISVAGAVDVAREAAEIILLDRQLDVLHNGIIEGRKAFGNVFKYLLMGTSSNFGNMFSMAGATLFLPFLPMLPTQILLNNFLYDLAQLTIPTDNVDPAYIRGPQRSDIRLIRNFMLMIGPISSLYDFLTFYVLIRGLHASEALFHTGWFVESLATQTLVLFVIRTVSRPWSNLPSLPLATTTVAIVMIGILLPYSPLAGALGFVPLPFGFFLFLVGVTVTYLLLVELAKRRLMARLFTRATA